LSRFIFPTVVERENNDKDPYPASGAEKQIPIPILLPFYKSFEPFENRALAAAPFDIFFGKFFYLL